MKLGVHAGEWSAAALPPRGRRLSPSKGASPSKGSHHLVLAHQASCRSGPIFGADRRRRKPFILTKDAPALYGVCQLNLPMPTSGARSGWMEELDGLRRRENADGKSAEIEQRKIELKNRIRGLQHDPQPLLERTSQAAGHAAAKLLEKAEPLRSVPFASGEALSSLPSSLSSLPSSLEALLQQLPAVQMPPVEVVPAFACGVGCGILFCVVPRYFQRFMTVEDIPIAYFKTQKRLRGKVVSVTDGDTFRMVPHKVSAFTKCLTTIPSLCRSTHRRLRARPCRVS
jgi:hypothetical protein